MKKIISTFVVAISLATLSTVCAADIEMNEPVVDGAVIKYSGKLIEGVTNHISFYVTDESGRYYHIGKTFADSETGVFSDSFRLGDEVPTENYKIVLSGVKMKESVSKTFKFYSKYDRDGLIQKMTAQDADVLALISEGDNAEILKRMQCDIDGLSALGDYQSVAVELIKSRQNGYYDADFTEEEFKEMFNFTVAFTATVKVPNSDLADKLKQYEKIFGIDTVGLKNSSFLDEKLRTLTAGSPESFRNVYNSARAVIAVNDELDYKNVRSVLEKHNNIFKIDFTKYTKLNEYKMAEVYQDLISRDYDTPEAVASAFDKKYKQLLNQNNISSPSGGGSSGGGGGYLPPQTSSNVVVKENDVKKVYSDLDGYAWAEEAINTLSEHNVIAGMGNNKFEPAEKVTREQFIKMVVAGFAIADSTAKCSFDDVKNDAWYYMYVASGVKNGIINGKTDMIFGAGDNITREDMAVILYRLAKKVSVKLPAGEISEFTDSENISDYAKEAVEKLSSAGIISGREDRSFGAKENATRAEAAKLIYEIWKLKY